MLIARLMEAELLEYAGHVAFDGGYCHHQFARDAVIGAALRDQRQHLTFARRQRVERAGLPLAADQRATTSGSSTDPPLATRRTASVNMLRSPTFSFSR
jgi:hypothetical protein